MVHKCFNFQLYIGMMKGWERPPMAMCQTYFLKRNFTLSRRVPLGSAQALFNSSEEKEIGRELELLLGIFIS